MTTNSYDVQTAREYVESVLADSTPRVIKQTMLVVELSGWQVAANIINEAKQEAKQEAERIINELEEFGAWMRGEIEYEDD